MISDRLKEIIFNKLYNDLSRVEIIPHGDHIWFIDRDNKYWYFRYCKSDGRLLWRYGFFESFFSFFTFDFSEYTPILSSWVEEVLNYKVDTTRCRMVIESRMVEEVLNYKVDKSSACWRNCAGQVGEVLNHKVVTTKFIYDSNRKKVEEVLNHKVTTRDKLLRINREVDEVLFHTVNSNGPANFGGGVMMEAVLNHKVTKTPFVDGDLGVKVDEVLNSNVGLYHFHIFIFI